MPGLERKDVDITLEDCTALSSLKILARTGDVSRLAGLLALSSPAVRISHRSMSLACLISTTRR
jgi:hypothetical protein